MRIQQHALILDNGERATFKATKNMGRAIQPLYLVLHYTAGTSAQAAVDWFVNPAARASAHLVVDRDGAITQMVPFNRRAWHAGESRWGELSDLNTYSIGIELVNAGKLSQRADGTWQNWSKKAIPASEVTLAKHKNEASEHGWHEYTTAQIEATIAIGTALTKQYGLRDVLGHDDIAPARKVDPGPLFPTESVRARVLGRA